MKKDRDASEHVTNWLLKLENVRKYVIHEKRSGHCHQTDARSQGLSVYIQGYFQVKLLSYPKQHVSCKAWVEYRLFHAPGNHTAKQNTKRLEIALFTRKTLFSNSALSRLWTVC